MSYEIETLKEELENYFGEDYNAKTGVWEPYISYEGREVARLIRKLLALAEEVE